MNAYERFYAVDEGNSPFIFEVDMSLTPEGGDATTFVIPFDTGGSYTVNCLLIVDGVTIRNITSRSDNVVSNLSGVHEIRLLGIFSNFNFTLGDGVDRLKITEISQWGSMSWRIGSGAFDGCSNLIVTATDYVKLPYNCVNMFRGIKGYASIGSLDVSSVTSGLNFLYNISNPINTIPPFWGNVTTMRRCFMNDNLSQLESLEIIAPNCTAMDYCFNNCNEINVRPIINAPLENIEYMFDYTMVTKSLGGVDVTQVTSRQLWIRGGYVSMPPSEVDHWLTEWRDRAVVKGMVSGIPWHMQDLQCTSIGWAAKLEMESLYNITFTNLTQI